MGAYATRGQPGGHYLGEDIPEVFAPTTQGIGNGSVLGLTRNRITEARENLRSKLIPSFYSPTDYKEIKMDHFNKGAFLIRRKEVNQLKNNNNGIITNRSGYLDVKKFLYNTKEYFKNINVIFYKFVYLITHYLYI